MRGEGYQSVLTRLMTEGRRLSIAYGQSEATTYAIRAQAHGDLLGVWSAPRHCFPLPGLPVHLLRRHTGGRCHTPRILPSEDHRAGSRRAFWLFSPHTLLEGRTPAEIFIDDPARVIAAAREEFQFDRDATW